MVSFLKRYQFHQIGTPLLSGRLEICLLFTVESTLTFSCSRSDTPLFRQGAALAHLDSLPPHDLVLWTDGSIPFLLGKGGSGVLANCSLCGTEATLSFSAGPAQYVQVFPLKPAPFCMFFAGLGSTNKSAISLLFFSCLTLVLSSPPSFLLSQTLWQIWQELSSLSSCSIRLRWVPGHLFLPGNDTADKLARRGALLTPSAIPRSLSPRIRSRFSRTGGVLSLRSILTHRFPRFPLRNLCSLVFAAMDTALC